MADEYHGPLIEAAAVEIRRHVVNLEPRDWLNTTSSVRNRYRAAALAARKVFEEQDHG